MVAGIGLGNTDRTKRWMKNTPKRYSAGPSFVSSGLFGFLFLGLELVEEAEKLVCRRPVHDGLSDVFPENRAVPGDDEYRRDRDLPLCVGHPVLCHDLPVRIREEREPDSAVFSQIPRICSLVHAHCRKSRSPGLEGSELIGQLAELAPAKQSPVAPVENQNSRTLRDQSFQGNLAAVRVRQVKRWGPAANCHALLTGVHEEPASDHAQKDCGRKERLEDTVPGGPALGDKRIPS